MNHLSYFIGYDLSMKVYRVLSYHNHNLCMCTKNSISQDPFWRQLTDRLAFHARHQLCVKGFCSYASYVFICRFTSLFHRDLPLWYYNYTIGQWYNSTRNSRALNSCIGLYHISLWPKAICGYTTLKRSWRVVSEGFNKTTRIPKEIR